MMATPETAVEGHCATIDDPGVYPDGRAGRMTRHRNAPATPGNATVTALDRGAPNCDVDGWSGGRAVAYHAGSRAGAVSPSAG
jgi:hypothetical protein